VSTTLTQNASSKRSAGSPWHAGEIKLQRLVGVAERMQDVGRQVIRRFMPDQHRSFFSQLPFVALGTVDHDGDVWATLVAGTPGFLHAPTERTLQVDLVRDPRDPASVGLDDGGAVGLLGIELHTRRRNRLNGVVSHSTRASFNVNVLQSFGNCPQYIQVRDAEFVRDPASLAPVEPVHLEHLSERARSMIETADTFFVASYVDDLAGRQVDVSHRGGRAGFVRLSEDGVLTIPDFAGNLFFATLGNFLINPRAGLVFADFERGDLLQLTGEAQVDLDSPEITAFQGAERIWRFKPRRIIYRAGALPLRWKLRSNGWSPNSLMTGSWDEVASRLKAQALADSWRPFEVTKVIDESSVIRSFHLEPVDGAGLIPHSAGQHLPIRVTPPGFAKPEIRTYTLSTAPADGLYRISVKRQGLVSTHLHDMLQVGSVIETRAPAGQFTIDPAERRPAVLLAAGVGVTPMLAMLRHIVYEGVRTRRVRPTWFFHSARTLAERAFTKEIDQLAAAANGAVQVVRTLTRSEGAQMGKDFDVAGRLDVPLLSETLPFNDYDFYLCGPAAFMQSLYDGLRKLNIADNRIHAEAFGQAGLRRQTDVSGDGSPVRLPADKPTPVAFVKSGKEARWNSDSGSLLDLAESRGLSPVFGCRGGSCGTCRTRIVEGAVAYPIAPEFKVANDEALICCAVPAQAGEGSGEHLLLDL
jgi:ferredoxin-NADP reductase/predicted pyridoxine 5'-phosphate oxidase superfamily flavin-nucleotide-binding protein